MHPFKQRLFTIIKEKKEVRPAELEARLKVTRQYLHRFLKELREEGRVVLLGEANQARYVIAEKDFFLKAKEKIKAHTV